MMVYVGQFYGGPMCGVKVDLFADYPKGWRTTSVAGDGHYYVHAGGGRYVYSQTLEGHLIVAEVAEAKKRRG